jgi:hypothetical protein
MTMEWPELMPESGRLPESGDAQTIGLIRVMDIKMSCQQTLNISLFFDGTNNNDALDNLWRDSKKSTHTNVARLFNSALFVPANGIFKSYIPGIGTPFPQIGEQLYSTDGKVLGTGFNHRCIWAYTRVLNAVYNAISSDKTRILIRDSDAKSLCDAGARGDMTAFKPYLNRLAVAHKQAVDESAWPRTVKHIWINVIGFSRGAAGARAFVHRLIHEWAPGGMLVDQTGKHALPYQVNFMGLFDTVASIGLPESARAVINSRLLDGHARFAGDGALAIPDQVRFCLHAFSIHEQRMSFPLDSIRQGDAYPGDCRHEVAYPGVHSDVGGGYGPGAQGKSRDGDSSKLSQIPLHDMYLAALKYGVPLMAGDAILKDANIARDFALHPDTIAAFNGWRKSVVQAHCIEDAIRFGMGQMLAWRTLRARIGTGQYVTEQAFFQHAREDALTPHQVKQALDTARQADPQWLALQAQYDHAMQQRTLAIGSAAYPANMAAIEQADETLVQLKAAIRSRQEALCGELAHPDAPAGPLPNAARPGEGALDVTINDQTDLREGAEEMRLLLARLYPEQKEQWQVREQAPARPANHAYPVSPPRTVLWVRHEQPGSVSPRVTLVDIADIKVDATRTSLIKTYDVADDVVPQPIEDALTFLKAHTSQQAAAALPEAVITLFDHHVHDSRCGFRVPYFHEYAPGGYCWPRVVFIGNSTRAACLGFDPLSVARAGPDANVPNTSAWA